MKPPKIAKPCSHRLPLYLCFDTIVLFDKLAIPQKAARQARAGLQVYTKILEERKRGEVLREEKEG
jgi:hypothetical protein